MTEAQFWKLIESNGNGMPDQSDEQHDSTLAALTKLPPAEIVAFDRIYRAKMVAAYRWDLWGAAYQINGGCSDDGFTDFRAWLISCGKKRFEAALADPDTLAAFAPAEEASFEEFGYLALAAYLDSTGETMPLADPNQPEEPIGEHWDFEDQDECRRRLPRVAKKFAG